MKINPFLTLIATATSLLLGYLAFLVTNEVENPWVVFVVASISFLSTLIPLFGLSHESGALTANLKTLSILGVIVMLISQAVMNLMIIRLEYYIIISSLCVLLFLGAYYALSKVDIK